MRSYQLSGDDVLLTVPTSDDIDAIVDLCQDESLQRWTSVPVPYQRADAEWFVRDYVPGRWASGMELTWAVREPGQHGVQGMIGLSLDGAGSGELGIWVGASARGRGLATRAARLVAEHAFSADGLRLERLLWQAHVGNWTSRRVAWRLGFKVEGTVRSHLVQRGERRDVWVATLLASDPMKPAHRWFDVPVLTGHRVMLRRFVDADAEAVAEACSDPDSRQWLGDLPNPYTVEMAERFIASQEDDHAAGRSVHWAAAPANGGPAVGSISLLYIDERHGPGSAEVGYWLHPAARGAGLATEAVGLLIRHAFANVGDGGLGLRRLALARADGNDASARVAERCGFRQYGLERAAERLGDGTFADLYWYDLLASDLDRLR